MTKKIVSQSAVGAMTGLEIILEKQRNLDYAEVSTINIEGVGMKSTLTDIGGKIKKSDDRYVVIDKPIGENLVLSSTRLEPRCKTNGHSHDEQDEVYFFVEGSGVIEVGSRMFEVTEGDVVSIEAGEFHKVHNTQKQTALYFVCVFNGERE